MTNQPGIMKNHGNQPKTMETNQKPWKTMKPPWKTMETNQIPWKTMNQPWKTIETNKNHEKWPRFLLFQKRHRQNLLKNVINWFKKELEKAHFKKKGLKEVLKKVIFLKKETVKSNSNTVLEKGGKPRVLEDMV